MSSSGSRAEGSILEIEVERGLILRSHLRMTGSWELYERGARWRKPRHLARAVLETEHSAAVCFAAPVVEIGRRGDGGLDHLGPDLCVVPVDIDEIVRRVEEWADPEVRDRRCPSRSAARGRDRQRLQVRGPLRLRGRPVRAARCCLGRAPSSALRDGGGPTPGQPRPLPSGHAGRRSRRLRSSSAGLSVCAGPESGRRHRGCTAGRPGGVRPASRRSADGLRRRLLLCGDALAAEHVAVESWPPRSRRGG